MSIQIMHNQPTTQYEKRLADLGINYIAGVDEVGRGAWAGPLVAAAVIMPTKPRLRGIRDSKQLTPNKRLQFSAAIKNIAIDWALGVVTAQEIDVKGITEANALAMERAIQKLHHTPEHVLVDAFRFFRGSMSFTAIDHGDALVYSIAASSIIAKVARDQMMCQYHFSFEQYGFAKHKGYGTIAHIAALKRYGISSLHRKSFQPIKLMI